MALLYVLKNVFIRVHLTSYNVDYVLQIEVKNENDTSQTLQEVEFMSVDQQFSLCTPPSVESLNIPPKSSTQFVFTVKGRSVDAFELCYCYIINFSGWKFRQ